MASQLSPTDAELIEELCRDVRRWAPGVRAQPSFRQVLPGGYSNTTVLLSNDSERWVLRIAGHSSERKRARQAEAAIQQAAASAGLAPRLCHHDPERGVMIMQYLDGRPDHPCNLSRLAQLLREVHALPRIGEPVHAPDLLRHYHSLLPSAHQLRLLLQQHGRDLEGARAALESCSDTAPVLCHNDLLSANRLVCDGRLFALDWEYAAPGDPFFELAVCASQWEASLGATLLNAYLQREATADDSARFAAQQLHYAAIEACWHACNHPGSTGEQRAFAGLIAQLRRQSDAGPHSDTDSQTGSPTHSRIDTQTNSRAISQAISQANSETKDHPA
jgi:aminoglycoside phosphotransferase (APT) family kinase protein